MPVYDDTQMNNENDTKMNVDGETPTILTAHILNQLLFRKLIEGLGEEFPVYPGFRELIEMMLETIRLSVNDKFYYTINDFFNIRMKLPEIIDYIKNNPMASILEIEARLRQGILDPITQEGFVPLRQVVAEIVGANSLGGKRKTYRRMNRRKSKKTLRRKSKKTLRRK